MDGTLLNAKIQRGYAMAASKIGQSVDVYRSTAANGIDSPIQPANKIATLPAAFSIKGQYTQAPGYNTNLWTVAIDLTNVKTGDVLQGATDTYVMVSTVPLLPPLALNTSNTVRVTRPSGPSGVGSVGYGEVTQTPVISGVPAFISQKKDSGHPPVGLPGDLSKRMYWEIDLYAPIGTIRAMDIVTDDLGYRYQVLGDDWNSPLGYQLLCERLEA